MGKESFDSDTAASDFTARVERLCPVQSTARTSLGALWKTLQQPLGSSVGVTSLPPSTTSLSPKCMGDCSTKLSLRAGPVSAQQRITRWPSAPPLSQPR